MDVHIARFATNGPPDMGTDLVIETTCRLKVGPQRLGLHAMMTARTLVPVPWQ